MILNNAPVNAAIMQNVSSVGEFHIRNSAKAFSILSSGLYANKIRAIIRELSCNAVDSHVAAGNTAPFEVHLPNAFEPWFSVKDYGVGLSHEQVVNMYTTYFESTKTGSNDFIGALGLGSKSPFSYTDNFTVNAIKDGTFNIYSAIINEEGVPSIVLMQSIKTDEPNGVEVRFSVNERMDFYKFISEAQYVFTYFKQRPKILGCADFEFSDVQYLDKDIIPGCSIKTSGVSVAVMGNIAYPINVPNPDTNLGALSGLLSASLELNFDIGELDFQASREGLSYIPSTITSIKKKLEQLNQRLTSYLAEEADKITDKWELAKFLDTRNSSGRIHKPAIVAYAKANPCQLYSVSPYFGLTTNMIDIDVAKGAYGTDIVPYYSNRGTLTKSRPNQNYKGLDPITRMPIYQNEIGFGVNQTFLIVINDLKVGAIERTRQYAKDKYISSYTNIYIVNNAVKGKPAKIDDFLSHIGNPPAAMIIKASDLPAKERVERVKMPTQTFSIVRLKEAHNGKMVWSAVGKSSDFPTDKKFYYFPVVGYELSDDTIAKDSREVFRALKESGIPEFRNLSIYGVRKTDLEAVKSMSNWYNVEDYIIEVLSKVSKKTISNFAACKVSVPNFIKASATIEAEVNESHFYKKSKKFTYLTPITYNIHSIDKLAKIYNKGKYLEQAIEKKVQSFRVDIEDISVRYPLLKNVGCYGTVFSLDDKKNVVDYIKAIDLFKFGKNV